MVCMEPTTSSLLVGPPPPQYGPWNPEAGHRQGWVRGVWGEMQRAPIAWKGAFGKEIFAVAAALGRRVRRGKRATLPVNRPHR